MRAWLIASAVVIASLAVGAGQEQDTGQTVKCRTGVELINVTATVTDRNGRFVAGLGRDDFRIYDDGVEQAITHFDSERVPVSLGLVLDTSASMDGEKIRAARAALDRFLFDLLDREDEIFLVRFDAEPELVVPWTDDRGRISQMLRQIRPRGGTALYDAVAEAVPVAQSGRHRKKAILVISDGNDTSSMTDVGSLQRLIRETEVLVYAIGIDGSSVRGTSGPQPRGGTLPPPRTPFPFPFPLPGRRTPPSSPGPIMRRGADERVNAAALRSLTDDSGGRTEIIRGAADLDPATAGIANELSQQYYLGYAAPDSKDGRWHTIRVEVRSSTYRVRARRGYVAGSERASSAVAERR